MGHSVTCSFICIMWVDADFVVSEVKHRPTVPDNIRYWQVLGGDKQVEKKNCS